MTALGEDRESARVLRAARTHLHFEQMGSGDNVLLIHGWTSSVRLWEDIAPVLAQHFRVTVVDLAGFGDSPLPDDFARNKHYILDVDTHSRILLDFCDELGLRPCRVVSHSMGGMITLRMALLRPDLFQRMVLIAPTVTGRIAFNANAFFGHPVGQFLSLRAEPLPRLLWSIAVSRWLIPMTMQPFYAREASKQRHARDIQRATWQAAVHGLVGISKVDLSPELGRIHQPALIVIGAADVTVPPDEGRLAARLLPNAQLVEYADAHHQPYEEYPDGLAQVIEFLQ